MPRIDWWIMMTSLWLPWGWMTYEEINNSQKKPQEQREKRVNRKEREAVADCYTYTPRTYIHMSARTHTPYQTKAISSQHCYKVTLHKTTTESYCIELGSRPKENRAKKKGNSVK